MDEKQNTLYKDCLKAGYACVQVSFNNVFTSWKEERNGDIHDYPICDAESIPDLIHRYGAWIGFPTQDDIIGNFADQSGEDLFGDSQADGINIDETIFPEFNGRNHWEVLDKYFGEKSVELVEKAYGEALEQFIEKYFTVQMKSTTQRLICRSSTFPLDVDVSVNADCIEDLNLDSFGDGLQDILYDVLEEHIQPIALSKFCVPLGRINGEALVDIVIDLVDKATKDQLFIIREGYEDEPVPNDWLTDWLSEYYEDLSTHTIRNG